MKQVIQDSDFVKCPYCGKELKCIHWSHLRQHGKTFNEFQLEFPGYPTITLKKFNDGVEKRKVGYLNSKLKTKTLTCFYCKNTFEGNMNSSITYSVCKECNSKGLKNPKRQEAALIANGSIKKKYGVDNINKIDGVQKKRKETCIKKYGVSNPSMVKEFKEKRKNTNIEKYGEDVAMKNKEISQRSMDKMEEKHGVRHALQKEEFKEKARKTWTEKYGVDNPLKSGVVIEKVKETTYKKNSEKVLKILEYLNIQLEDPPYQHATYRHSFYCKTCGYKFKKLWSEIQQGSLCPKCTYGDCSKSKGEKEVGEFIEKDLMISNISYNNRNLISPLELDLVLPDLKIAIEYCGLYCHSEAQISKNLSYSNSLMKVPLYHIEKRNRCIEIGFTLITVFEDEWIYKQDIVKSRIRNMILPSSLQKINGRDCIVKEIDNQIKNLFLEQNHIQSKDTSLINLGAFYNDELVSVMTFKHGNISKGSRPIEGVFELSRFCTKINLKIPGIAGKMLSFFKKNYVWYKIFSYADLRWSRDGKLYRTLGFLCDEKIRLNYWYIKNGYPERIHRFSLRKRADEPKDIPERILRLKEGYNRIWDCGNLKFTMENENSKGEISEKKN